MLKLLEDIQNGLVLKVKIWNTNLGVLGKGDDIIQVVFKTYAIKG